MCAVAAPSAAVEVAELIEHVRGTVAASVLIDQSLLNRIRNADVGPILAETLRLRRNDGTEYEINVEDIVLHLEDSAYHADLVLAQFSAAIILVGDALRRNSYFNLQRPEFEFFRLLRKAVNHGNRWRFQGNALARKAQFKDITLNKAMADRIVLFEALGPGDVLDLFDVMAARLRKIG